MMMAMKRHSHLLPFLLWMLLGFLASFEITYAFQPILLQSQPQQRNPTTSVSQKKRNLLIAEEARRPSFPSSDDTTRRHDVSLAATSSSSSSSSSTSRGRRRRRQLTKDVVIIGGGLAGLSVALYLSQIDPDRHVTILDKEEIDAKSKNAVASFAAAGMLAPHSERLPKGSLLDLCLESRQMYPDFCDLVETLAEDAGEEGLRFLPPQDSSNNDMEPWNIGFVGAGGFLAPAFAGDNVATWAPPEDSKGNAKWLDSYQVRELEPNLDSKVVGGWWFPEDASVDSRRLTCSLRAACVGTGVEYLSGGNYEVSSLDLSDGKCHGLWLKNGKYISAKSVLVANGSWMRTLLPVPLEPHKGQSLSLRMPKDRPPLLRRVLFAQDSYIVPKADGRIVIGATVEAGSFDPNVTPAGIMHILSYALELVPALKDLPLDETWAGLRPTTPDKGPILGETPWENLFLAGGYWRNGVLLAPKTGELLASLIAGEPLSDQDRRFLEEFAWDRFTAPGKGAALAANARFAASMYPVHTRKSGVGVAAAVGTELGSYSTARSAGEERARDRDSLWGAADDDDAFERAANLGKLDGTAFYDDSSDDDEEEEESGSATSASAATTTTSETSTESSNNSTWAGLLESSPNNGETRPYDGSPDALTVPYSEEGSSNKKNDLQSMYASIQKNKAGQSVELDDTTSDDRPDPGFRIYHVNKKTGKETEVPPYTSPGDFIASINNNDDNPKEEECESKESFDGYSTILNAAAKDSNIKETMRKARMSNRVGDEGIDMDIDFSGPTCTNTPNGSSPAVQTPDSTPTTDLSDVYQKIRDQKTVSTATIEDESDIEERPDPGFRIYHIDKETGEHREVPPYTSPGDFLASFQKQDNSPPPPPPASSASDTTPNNANSSTPKQQQEDDYSEKTYDGYQDIIEANASVSRDDELAAMREARRSNRIGQETISESDL